MGITANQLAAELRAFDGRRALVQAMRRGLTRAAGPVRKKVKAHAIETLPSGNGLGKWVAAARVGVKISYASRSAGVTLKGSRRSRKDRSDLRGIDAGRVRAPSWGQRTQASWHTQTVPPGWWSDPLSDADEFRDFAEQEIDRALEVIRG